VKTNKTKDRISETNFKTRTRSLINRIFVIFLLAGTLLFAGCPHHEDKSYLLEQIDQLTKERSELTHRLEKTESQNAELRQQVHVLSGLPEDKNIDNLCSIDSIAIGKLTNLYDENKDGKYDTLIVYLQTIDDQGDKVKIAGMADVQLWDLNRPDGQALLGAWRVEPQELKDRWVSFILTNYRLKFDISELINNYDKPLTVKVTFTDYLTGKVFREQKAIEPKSP
jgi:hypothetical protein